MAIPNGELPEDLDLLTAVLGKPIAWAYGRHIAAGNVVLIDDSPSDHRLLFVALAEGEWDAVENLWVNGEALTDRTGLADASGYLFHPGKAGTTGTGGETGSQSISRWFPAGVTQLNFSHTAYLAIWIARDLSAPGPDLDVRGIYRARKLQEYDANGTPTLFQWSANPSWEILDLLLSFYKLPTTRIDFGSFVTAAADCNVQVGGANRFEGHIFFTDEQGDQALDRLLSLCRGFLTDYNGKISLRIDQARASQHDFTMDNIAQGGFRWETSDTSRRPNRIVVKFRDTASNYAFVEKMVDDEAHQDKVKRITRAEIDLGNSTYGRAFRLGKYLLSRSTSLPELVRLRGLQDSFHLMPGDVVRVKHDAAPWTYAGGTPDFKDFEVLEASDSPSGERAFLLQEYAAATYSDAEETAQALLSPAVAAREGIAGYVTGQAVSEGPGFARDGHPVSNVTCSFTPPSPRKTWAGVELWETGLAGATQPVLVAAGGESPIIFQLESTNETITVYFVSVAADGRRRAVLTSPSATVLLDGQTSAPVPVSNLTGQSGGQLGESIRLTWSENVETDIDHYEIAKRATAALIQGNITNADIVATVAAAGVSATRKAQWDDAPGSADGTRYYYVRAVNLNNLASDWRPDPPATLAIIAYAPDGTTDTGVPNGAPPSGSEGFVPGASYTVLHGESLDARAQAGATVLEYAAPGSIPASNNMAGVFAYEFEIKTWADKAGTSDAQIKKFQFPFVPLVNARFVLEFQNRYIEYFKVRLHNYFGFSLQSTLAAWSPGALPYMASQAQDVGDGNFNPNTSSGRNAGLNTVKALSSNNLTLDTTAAAGKATSAKEIESTLRLRAPELTNASGDLTITTSSAANKITSPREIESTLRLNAPEVRGDTITTRAAAGDLTLTTQGASNHIVAGRVLDASGSGFLHRDFLQAARPTLNSKETAFYYRTGDGLGGLLHFDGTNYWWWRAASGGTVIAELNPA